MQLQVFAPGRHENLAYSQELKAMYLGAQRLFVTDGIRIDVAILLHKIVRPAETDYLKLEESTLLSIPDYMYSKTLYKR